MTLGERWAWFITALLGLMVVVALAIVGWHLHWWLAQSSTNHQNHINRSSYSFQQTLRDELQQELTDISSINVQITQYPASTAALTSQRIAITDQACQQASELTGGDVPTNVATFVSQTCGATP